MRDASREQADGRELLALHDDLAHFVALGEIATGAQELSIAAAAQRVEANQAESDLDGKLGTILEQGGDLGGAANDLRLAVFQILEEALAVGGAHLGRHEQTGGLADDLQ